jgi:FkbM family methyltransferase
LNISNLFRRKHSALTLLSLRALRDLPPSEFRDAVRSLCKTALMTDDMVLCRTLGRYKMFVDKADLGFSSHIILDGFWQVWATRAILKTVREGMSVVDAGANVGYYTLLLADLVGKSGHVHAIEPNPRALRLLQQSVSMNGFAGRVALHGRFRSTPAKAPLIRSSHAVSGRKAPFVRTAAARATLTGLRGLDQQRVCIDDLVNDEKLDFIRIEGNGAERDTWNGMQRILARQQPLTVMLEFTLDHYREPDNFLAGVTAASFKLARVDISGSIAKVSTEEILASSSSDSQTLLLSR